MDPSSTATRSGEVRGARWDEIDLDAAVWTVPAQRTKTNKAHRVPLSRRGLDVLADARAYADASGLVFPSATGRQLSDSTMSKLLRELDIAAVPHGFRSSFRSWCADTGAPREVAKAALGHIVKGVEGAYQRSDLLETRRDVMNQWAAYLQERAQYPTRRICEKSGQRARGVLGSLHLTTENPRRPLAAPPKKATGMNRRSYASLTCSPRRA